MRRYRGEFAKTVAVLSTKCGFINVNVMTRDCARHHLAAPSSAITRNCFAMKCLDARFKANSRNIHCFRRRSPLALYIVLATHDHIVNTCVQAITTRNRYKAAKPRPKQNNATAQTISLYIPPASCILRIITAARIPKHTLYQASSSISTYFTLFHIHSEDVF